MADDAVPGALAGAVFTAALIMLLWAAGIYLRVGTTPLLRATMVVAALSAPFAWRAFRRLEVPAGPQAEVDLLGWSRDRSHRSSKLTRRLPLIAAALKELRLQQMTMVVGIVYGVIWTVVTLIKQLAPGALPAPTLYVVTMFYGGLVSVMAGALTCAEERRFGAADWQHLLPLAFWQQWALKLSIAAGTALVLVVTIPAMLQTLSPDPLLTERFHPGAVAFVFICAVYVSSLSTNGLHALLATPAVMVCANTVALVLIWPLTIAARPVVDILAGILHPTVSLDREAFRWWGNSYFWEVTGAWVVLRFAALNFRTSDRGWRRIAHQAAVAFAIGAAGVLFSMLLSALFQQWLQSVRVSASVL